MLYVFHVDTGTMMTFDMNLAMERVSNLQAVIARGCRIQEDKQVLLISGGESLDPAAVVGKYHAGTDTNPIYLFSKSTIEAATPPSPSVNYGSDVDLQSQVEGSLLMPPAYETVVSRAQLALQFQDVDVEELRACERLIHDQHLQQQGWAAVVANLEDITGELKQRSNTFQEAYTQYLNDRQTYRALIASVSQSLQLLSKIPLLPSLSGPSKDAISQDSTDSSGKSSLFDWINSQDTNHSLQDMVEQCDKATEQLDENVGASLKAEVEHLFKEVLNENMKEVKGLEDRLYGLDQIISGARKVVQEQGELAQGFVHNQNRLSDLRDRSILPDLCSSHRNQLVEMLKNHTRLREIKKKCRMAKEELSVNLHTRLRWIMYVEKKICDVDGKLTIYLGNLKRMIKRLDILQQVHVAPKVYAQMVIEVVRRKKFSNQFLSWAVSLAEDSNKLHTEEVRRREAFLVDIGHHFLQSMFQGLEECALPAFATEAPAVFDQNLPNITVDDIKQLKESVPELSGVLSLPVEEDFFQEFLHIKESLVQLSEQHLSMRQVTTGTGSEIDIVQIDRLQPYSLEGGSVSLGDQFTECEGEEIIPKQGFDSLSPPDKEFLLAKSLSEELTKEMKEEQKLLKQKSLSDLKTLRQDTPDGKGGKAKDPIAQIKDQHSRAHRISSGGKAGVDMSPDMETSQEFSTADFYIDESMPSSIESPPKTSTCVENKTNLEQVLEEERNTVTRLQEELKESNLKLSVSECKIKSLKQLVDDKLPELKEIVKGFKTQHSDSKETFEEEFSSLKQSLAETLKHFGETLNSESQAVIDKMVHERQENDRALSEKLEAEMAKSASLEQKVDSLNQCLSEKETLHKEDMEKLRTEKGDLGEKLARDIQELTLKHELELEVETDKAKSELLTKIENLEKELETKDIVIKDKESAINNFKAEKVKLEEDLTGKFQKEKDEICTLLGKEYDEKMGKAIENEKHRLDEMKQKLKEELQNLHERDVQQKIQELKQSFIQEKQEAVEMTQSMLTEEHVKSANEIKQKLVEEKESEFKKLVQEIEIKFQEDMTKLSTEFNKEKEALVKELESFKSKDVSDGENQTSLSLFNTTHCDSQTEPAPVKLETQVQTEVPDQSHVTSQTETKEHVQLSTQTETSQISNLSVQTEIIDCTQLSTQTDSTDASNTSMQTEKCEFKTPVENQSDTCSQTESKDNSQSGTQTESVIVDQSTSDKKDQESEDHTKSSDDAQVDYTAKISELQKEFEKKLAEAEERHREDLDNLIFQLEKEKEDAQQLKTSLTSMAGDKQIKFNEAVNKVCQEKDRIIEELKAKENEYLAQRQKDIETLEQVRKEKAKVEDVKERAMAFLKDKEQEFGARQRQLESELGLAEQQLQQYKEQLQNMGSDILESSSATASPSVVNISEVEDPEIQQRIKDLEDVVRMKDEELNKMQQKVMELSMSSSTRSLVQDKVSITSCHGGDLVLLCLDERLDQYVVFTVGTTLHFLHTDCLVPLGLKAGLGETRKQWLIAEVTDKEYCQAKKPNNRFRVPVGSKFYRVKAKKWSRDTVQSPAKKSDTASGGT